MSPKLGLFWGLLALIVHQSTSNTTPTSISTSSTPTTTLDDVTTAQGHLGDDVIESQGHEGTSQGQMMEDGEIMSEGQMSDDSATSQGPTSADGASTQGHLPEARSSEGHVMSSLGHVNNIQRLTRPRAPPRTADNSGVGAWESEPNGVHWLLNLYNPHHWNPSLLPDRQKISGECRSAMKQYLISLANGTVWAAKMSDASGRYSSQFFFGNDFWLGSHTLCKELQNTRANQNVPPFRTSFYVAKLRLKLHHEMTPKVREISLGVCLPSSCQKQDVTTLLQPEQTPPEHSFEVLRVRSVPGDYSIFHDPKLHIAGTVTLVILILMVIGTGYEYMFELQDQQNSKKKGKQAAVAATTLTASVHQMSAASSKLGSALEVVINDKQNLNNSGSDLSTDSYTPAKRTKTEELLLCFSCLSNSRKILHCGAAPKDSLTCVHGLRFLSLAWVIMVHTYLQVFAIAENKTLRTLTERNFMFQTVSNATFSVDTFFFISGLLVTFLYFKSSNRTSSSGEREGERARPSPEGFLAFKIGFLKFCKLVGYRFLRLTPAYMFVLCVASIAMRWLKSNSVFEPVSLDDSNCDKYWWRNALYINSLFPRKDMCMLWSWYMSNDTQFYIIGIVILLISARHLKVASGLLVVFLVSSCVTTALVAVRYDYIVKIEEPFALFDELYDKPWTRLGPYLVGMFAGWFLFKTNARIRISLFTTLSGWLLSLLTLTGLVYGVLGSRMGVASSALYIALGHTAWGAALAWIVIACCCGYGGFVNSLLSCRLLHPLSRLTYCAYLIHPVIMVLTSFQMDGPLHLHNGLVFILYFGNLVAAFLLSFFISITYEAPIVRLLKVLL
ncbi:O-acyltransferase like protein-like isoform X3 [Nilaparvata lugens]|nr:O-acyltransferase like protein-like isoform X3 [Nilaparvata lugens]